MTDYTMEGRTYRYFSGDPLYPFGYGLSYSKFEYTKLDAPKSVPQGEVVKIRVAVRNLGPYDADEVFEEYCKPFNLASLLFSLFTFQLF